MHIVTESWYNKAIYIYPKLGPDPKTNTTSP